MQIILYILDILSPPSLGLIIIHLKYIVVAIISAMHYFVSFIFTFCSFIGFVDKYFLKFQILLPVL